MTGADLGRVTERSFDEDKGIILDYHHKGKLLVKARWFRKPDGLEKILVEGGSSKRLATIDGEPSRDNSLIAKLVSGLALRPYQISNADGERIGAMTVRDGIKKSIQYACIAIPFVWKRDSKPFIDLYVDFSTHEGN